MRNVPQPSPIFGQPFLGRFGHEIELVQIDGVPGNYGILFERRLEFFACGINRRIDIFQLAARGIFHDARPGIIGFAESDGVGVARTAIAAEGFVGHFRDVRSAHDHGDADGAHGVGHAIGLGDHAGHGADADQINLLFDHVAGDSGFVHGLSVAIDQDDFVFCGSERLQEEHPEVRHEIARDPVVGVVQEDFQYFPDFSAPEK